MSAAMENITVDKVRLLETLTANREEHQAIFAKAQVAYREKVIEVLDQRLADARAGRKIITFLNLPEPTDYTDAFDRAIKMVEWQEGETIELSEHDFERYVMNDWEWQGKFAASTQSYVS